LETRFCKNASPMIINRWCGFPRHRCDLHRWRKFGDANFFRHRWEFFRVSNKGFWHSDMASDTLKVRRSPSWTNKKGIISVHLIFENLTTLIQGGC